MVRWTNWAGDERCTPETYARPRTRAGLASAVHAGLEAERRIRVVGSGHSFSDIALGEGALLSVGALNRLLELDRSSGLVRVEAGIVLAELGWRLDGHGLALENLGDIDRQTLAGAISTATHGTGERFGNVSSQVEAIELIDGRGSWVELGSGDPRLRAARVGLGALGAVYAVTLRTVPRFTLRRVDRPRPIEEVLATLDELVAASDHFEFFVFPHTRLALTRETTRTDAPPQPGNRALGYAMEVGVENLVVEAAGRTGRSHPRLIPALSRLIAERLMRGGTKTDRSHRVFASRRWVRFTEMEYAISRRGAVEAIRRVLELAESEDVDVGFPIEVRFVAADDALLSPSHERPSCYVAVHMFEGMPWERYFHGVEAIMDAYEGRPHWGKRHFQTAAYLSERYPRWEEFRRIRRELDPGGAFGNAYTDRVLGS